MRERPILFSAPMVRAILGGLKTQTRRAIKPQPTIDAQGNFCWNGWNYGQDTRGVPHVQAIASPLPRSVTGRVACPYGRPGDQLWVRETGWERPERTPRMMRDGADTWAPYYYDADGLDESDAANLRRCGFKRRPSIHMPRWASRILLEITGVRVERLQDVSECDAIAEGIERDAEGRFMNYLDLERGGYFDHPQHAARSSHASLWDRINGPGSWALNPWVWVIEFRRIEAAEQQPKAA